MASLWLRATARRLGRATTIVLTLAVMSVATVGALVGGDTLDRLFAADAAAEWGEVDVEVRATEDGVIDESLARLLVIESGATNDAGAPRLVLQGLARRRGTAGEEVLVLGLGGEERTFAPLRAVRGTADPVALGRDGALINARLARRLPAAVGDTITLTVAAPAWQEEIRTQSEPRFHQPVARRLEVRVEGIVGDTGAADLHRTPNVVVRREVLQEATGLEGRVTVVHLSAARAGRDGAEAVVDELAPLTRTLDLEAEPVRADAADIAEEEGGLFRSILLTLALLVLAAAAVATYGLLVTLGEQRARELVVLRAMGARRRSLTTLLVAESAVYGVLGAALGAVGGIPFGLALSGALADHFADLGTGRGREQVLVAAVVSPASVLAGCVVVALVAAIAGRSAARIVLAADIAEVLRGHAARLQAPDRGLRRATWLLALGAFLLGLGVLAGPSVLLLGSTLLLCAWWVRGRRASAHPARFDQRAAAGGLVWSLAGAALLGDLGAGVQQGFGTIIIAGTTAILSTSILLGQRLQGIMGWVRAYVPRGPAQAALRTSAANAQSTPRRSATVMATFGVALFMLASMSVLGSAQDLDLDRQAGGFDVIGTSVGGLDTRRLTRPAEVGHLATAPEALLPEPAFAVDTGGGLARVPYPVRLIGASGAVAEAQAFGLAAHLPAFPTARAALSAVATDRDKVVLDRAALPEGAHVGDDVVIDVGDTPRRFRLVAVLDTYLLSGAFVNEAEFGQLMPLRGPTMVFAGAAGGTSAPALAARLAGLGRDEGLTAKPVARIRDEVVATNRTFTDTFAVMVVLALAVALASVAAYVALATRERRSELALLRAVGMRRRAVVLTLAAEPVLTGTLGAVAGLAVGLVYLRVLFAVGFSELAFVVDWVRVGAVTAGSVVLLALTCWATARLTAPRDLAAELRDLG